MFLFQILDHALQLVSLRLPFVFLYILGALTVTYTLCNLLVDLFEGAVLLILLKKELLQQVQPAHRICVCLSKLVELPSMDVKPVHKRPAHVFYELTRFSHEIEPEKVKVRQVSS